MVVVKLTATVVARTDDVDGGGENSGVRACEGEMYAGGRGSHGELRRRVVHDERDGQERNK
ncbi:hypothetical protein A2U01_0029303, partial [Trifolium medium]|nr:hypothetical protein [Trifolium medium]